MRLTKRSPLSARAEGRRAARRLARSGSARHGGERLPADAGLSLLEVVAGLSIFVVLLLSVSLTVTQGMKQRKEAFSLYRAQGALRNLIAEMQETANLPQDLGTQEGVGALYVKYNNQTFSVPELDSGKVLVTVSATESTVPTVLGGPQDLNLDGDAQDNLDSVAAGNDLKLVPVSLTLTFTEDNATHIVRAHRLLTRTAGR